MTQAIQTADLDWQLVDGIDIPVSKVFGDVYFSKANGLLETRHVFINGNDLHERLSDLKPFEHFTVGETGFGTGLNILTLWQLWQSIRPNNHSQLHVITVEKFPLSKTDLIRALNAWPELKHLSDQLIAQYPLPIAGCHRLHFPDERFSIDIWLGDAHDVFPVIAKTSTVNAWFLDGFAPACNPDMWEEQVLNQIIRLSDIGTTFASFSVAGILKRGLKKHGVKITRPKGFGHKREMLKGVLLPLDEEAEKSELSPEDYQYKPHSSSQRCIGIVGAGIAGLSCAYAFALRGHRVRLFDHHEPLSGASGNPLALLNPKLCPIEQSADHLMTLAWQHAMNHYSKFEAFDAAQVHQIPLKHADELLDLANQYPENILEANSAAENSLFNQAFLTLKQAGTIRPHDLAKEILSNELIEFQQATIKSWHLLANHQVGITDHVGQQYQFDHVIICCARESMNLFDDFPILKPIRGQVSWFNHVSSSQFKKHEAYSYGGYCMPLNDHQIILGASFYPNRDDQDVLDEDHEHNYRLLADLAPDIAAQFPDHHSWHGRASVRAQSQDYFPLLGQIESDTEIYTLSGLGSKGFLFAPLCAEILVAQILKTACPVSETLLNKLNVHRFRKKVRIKKPYFQDKTQSS